MAWTGVSSFFLHNLQIASSARTMLCMCVCSVQWPVRRPIVTLTVFLFLPNRSLVNFDLCFVKNSFACLDPGDVYHHSLNMLWIHSLMNFLICDLMVLSKAPVWTNGFDESGLDRQIVCYLHAFGAGKSSKVNFLWQPTSFKSLMQSQTSVVSNTYWTSRFKCCLAIQAKSDAFTWLSTFFYCSNAVIKCCYLNLREYL